MQVKLKKSIKLSNKLQSRENQDKKEVLAKKVWPKKLIFLN
jgi:hypothetical protein